jgi:hypothetical protein
MVLIKIQVFWDITLCHLLNTGVSKQVKLNCLAVKMKALQSFKTVTTHRFKCHEIHIYIFFFFFPSPL